MLTSVLKNDAKERISTVAQYYSSIQLRRLDCKRMDGSIVTKGFADAIVDLVQLEANHNETSNTKSLIAIDDALHSKHYDRTSEIDGG